MERPIITITMVAVMFIFTGGCGDDYGYYDYYEDDYGYDDDYEDERSIQTSGTFTYKNGDTYNGELNADMYPHGQGTYVYKDYGKYVGQWAEGKMHGKGTFTWTDGSKYVGQFAENEITGVGEMFNTDGSSVKGYWENGELVERY